MTKKIRVQIDIDFENALDRATESPLRAANELRAAVKKERAGHYESIRQAMAVACAIFSALRPNEKDWRAFLIKAEEVETPYKPRENSDLAAVVLYVLSDTSYTQCIKYAAGLQLLVNEGVEPRDIPTAIKERGGIDGLYQEATRKHRKAQGPGTAQAEKRESPKRRSKPKTADTDQVDADHDDDEEGEASDGDEGNNPTERDDSDADAPPTASRKDIRAACELVRIAFEFGERWLVLEASKEVVATVLATQEGDSLSLQIENRGWRAGGLIRLGVAKLSRKQADDQND
jgi:hypothetical protein